MTSHFAQALGHGVIRNAGIEILPIALQTACKPCGFAAGRPAIVAGPVLRVAIGESCSVCRALKEERQQRAGQRKSEHNEAQG